MWMFIGDWVTPAVTFTRALESRSRAMTWCSAEQIRNVSKYVQSATDHMPISHCRVMTSRPTVQSWTSTGSSTCKYANPFERAGGVLCVWRWTGMLMFSLCLSCSNKWNSCRHASSPSITATISCSGGWPGYFLPRKLLSANYHLIVWCCSHCCTDLVSAGEWATIISLWT